MSFYRKYKFNRKCYENLHDQPGTKVGASPGSLPPDIAPKFVVAAFAGSSIRHDACKSPNTSHLPRGYAWRAGNL
jgi:hypothetical protein